TRCLSDWSSDVCSSDLGRRGHRVPLLSGIPKPSRRAASVPRGDQSMRNIPQGRRAERHMRLVTLLVIAAALAAPAKALATETARSEERRVGKECRAEWW